MCLCFPQRGPDSSVGAVYSLQRLLGRGSQGEVWLAREKSTKRSFALKFVSLSGEESGRVQPLRLGSCGPLPVTNVFT